MLHSRFDVAMQVSYTEGAAGLVGQCLISEKILTPGSRSRELACVGILTIATCDVIKAHLDYYNKLAVVCPSSARRICITACDP